MPPSGPLISARPETAPSPTEGETTAHAGPEFLSALCAEVGAGLRGVLALTELLERQPAGADSPAYVRTIADCSRTLLRVMADAEELSRAGEAGVTLAPEPVHLRDLLDAVQTEWAARAAEDGVGLGAVFVGEADLSAELDPAHLRRIYDILIGNALKLTRRGGVEVGLRAEPDGDRVRLHGLVRDTGLGIDPAQLPFLFQPFGPAARAPYASGLDLALARSTVEAMGGRIWAENNAGAGATIFFQLEARACGTLTNSGSETRQSEPGPVLTGRVLIVDDNATNRMVARTLVELFGCICETAEDGLEAVEAVARGGFDAVLMDINMPRMNGLAASRAIRALPSRAASVPIIALTANADAEDARTYRDAGLAGLVEKPIRSERLLLVLGEALARRPGGASQAAA